MKYFVVKGILVLSYQGFLEEMKLNGFEVSEEKIIHNQSGKSWDIQEDPHYIPRDRFNEYQKKFLTRKRAIQYTFYLMSIGKI